MTIPRFLAETVLRKKKKCVVRVCRKNEGIYLQRKRRTSNGLLNWQFPRLEGSKVGRKQTGSFACKYHELGIIKPQSAEDQCSFPGSKLLVNSPQNMWIGQICRLFTSTF